MSDATSPVFDRNGKYLYFLASTNDGPSKAGIDLSSLDRAQSSAAYVVVLAKDGVSPVPPESDDEKIKDAEKKEADKKDVDKKETDKKDEAAKTPDKKEGDKKDDKDKKDADKPVEVKIDLEKIGDRILALPIPARNYNQLFAGKTGVLYLAEGSPVGRPTDEDGSGIRALWRFTLEKRQPETVLGNLNAFVVSADGSKVLYARKGGWTIASADDLKPGSDAEPGQSGNRHRSPRRVAANLPRNLAH
jgi:tricorn protease